VLFEKRGVRQVHLQVAGSNGTDNLLNDKEADQCLHNQVLAGAEGGVEKDHVDWAGRLQELAGGQRCSCAFGRSCQNPPFPLRLLCTQADLCLRAQ
jgi:hypothetical protein